MMNEFHKKVDLKPYPEWMSEIIQQLREIDDLSIRKALIDAIFVGESKIEALERLKDH